MYATYTFISSLGLCLTLWAVSRFTGQNGSVITLGEGTFGKVTLTKDPETKRYEACKTVLSSRQVESERSILRIVAGPKADHCPFVASFYRGEQQLKRTLRRKNLLHDLLYMEPCLGGELYYLMEKLKKRKKWFSYKQLITYFGQMVIAVEHLRKNRVISRDIKPENFVLDHNYNLKMIDFGLAVQIPEGQDEIPWKMIGKGGTPMYWPRENNKHKSIGLPFDLYSLGAVLRVMCTGQTKDISNHQNWLRQLKAKLGSKCIVKDADKDALNDLLTKLIGDRKGRTKCFEGQCSNLNCRNTRPKARPTTNSTDELICDQCSSDWLNIWNHPVFAKFGGPAFRDELLYEEVKHDRDVRRIIDRNVKKTLKDAPSDAERQFGVSNRRRRLLL